MCALPAPGPRTLCLQFISRPHLSIKAVINLEKVAAGSIGINEWALFITNDLSRFSFLKERQDMDSWNMFLLNNPWMRIVPLGPFILPHKMLQLSASRMPPKSTEIDICKKYEFTKKCKSIVFKLHFKIQHLRVNIAYPLDTPLLITILCREQDRIEFEFLRLNLKYFITT